MSATISTLPVWKKDSTPAEWLQEVATLALEHPENFARIVVVAEQLNRENIPDKCRVWTKNVLTNSDTMGVLVTAQHEIYEYMRGRK